MSQREDEQVKTFTQKKDDDHRDTKLEAMLLSGGQVSPAVLFAAIELNLFDIIAKATSEGGHVSPSEIASQLPTHNPDAPSRLDRMLRLLVSYSLLTCSTRTNQHGGIERLYGLSPTGEYFVSNDEGPAWASVFPRLSYHPFMTGVWQNFKKAIVDGGADLFNKINGQPMYQYIKTDSALKQMFQRAMADLSALHMENILEIYKGFEGLSTLVDVGGGIGKCLKMIISKYPSIKGINFDLPQVVQDAQPYPGLVHVGGDMFQRVPNADAIMIKGTTHNWSDEKCIQLFSNCYEALPKGGKVIVIDLIMPEEPEVISSAKYLALFDNVMLAQGGGMERNEKEFETLCTRSGFSLFKVACRVMSSILGVVEFYK